MAVDNSGTAMPVALVGDRCAHKIAFASQMGYIKADDGEMNPVDLFGSRAQPPMYQPAKPAFGMLVLNSMAAPLKLVDCVGSSGGQALYPAALDTGRVVTPTESLDHFGNVKNEHQIPAARLFPRHWTDAGGYAGVAGLGYYAHYAWSRFLYDSGGVQLGFSFAYSDDASVPRIAVAVNVDQDTWSSNDAPACSAVTAELPNNDLAHFLTTTAMAKLGNAYHVGTGTGVTIWATFGAKGHPMPTLLTNTRVLAVWVRNLQSTVG